jgi:hypothetical protein
MACNQSLEVLVWDVNRRHHRILHEEINWRSYELLLLIVEHYNW